MDQLNKKPSMLEKLTKEYWWIKQNKIKGMATGYYSEKFEMVKSIYRFPDGEFVLKNKTEQFFLWHYDANY